jgi:DsbC/DsbD-like thiol-disulfide interchange protein
LKSTPLSGALVAGLLVVASAVPGWGASTGESRNVTVALVSEQVAVQPGRPFLVGLVMRMRGGWHTYWKNPGDAGLPLRIAWKLPEGFSAGPIQWPVPERIPAGPVMSYGYEGEVLLPIEITPPSRVGVDSATIAGTFDWLECNEVCLPGSAVLDLTLPVRAAPTSPAPAAPMFAEARSRMPRAPAGWTFSAEAGPRAISLAVRVPPGFSTRGAYLFLDKPLVADFGAPQGFERIPDGYRVTMTPATNAPRQPERLTGVLVFDERAGRRPRTALQIDVPVSLGDPAPAPVQSERGGPLPAAAYAAMFALLGLGLALLLRRVARFHRG